MEETFFLDSTSRAEDKMDGRTKTLSNATKFVSILKQNPLTNISLSFFFHFLFIRRIDVGEFLIRKAFVRTRVRDNSSIDQRMCPLIHMLMSYPKD